MANVTCKPARPLTKAELAEMMEHLTPESMRWCRNRYKGRIPGAETVGGVTLERKNHNDLARFSLRVLMKPLSNGEHWRLQEPLASREDSFHTDLQDIEARACASLLLIREEFLAEIARVLLASCGALTNCVSRS